MKLISLLITLLLFTLNSQAFFGNAMQAQFDEQIGSEIKLIEKWLKGKPRKQKMARERAGTLIKDINRLGKKHDISDLTAETKNGRVKVADLKKYLTSIQKGGKKGPYMGCGVAMLDIKGTGTSKRWSPHTIHPASAGGQYSPRKRPSYGVTDCKDMPKGHDVAADVKPYVKQIVKTCGKGSKVKTPQGGFGTVKVGKDLYKREALIYCYMKRKAAWMEGSQSF